MHFEDKATKNSNRAFCYIYHILGDFGWDLLCFALHSLLIFTGLLISYKEVMNLAHKYDTEDFDRGYKCFCLFFKK